MYYTLHNGTKTFHWNHLFHSFLPYRENTPENSGSWRKNVVFQLKLILIRISHKNELSVICQKGFYINRHQRPSLCGEMGSQRKRKVMKQKDEDRRWHIENMEEKASPAGALCVCMKPTNRETYFPPTYWLFTGKIPDEGDEMIFFGQSVHSHCIFNII